MNRLLSLVQLLLLMTTQLIDKNAWVISTQYQLRNLNFYLRLIITLEVDLITSK